MADRILIIDDDLDTLKLVGIALQRQGYEIMAASNGRQGVIQAEEELPDLILLDVMMPEMDGYEVARRLRANEDTAAIPILMFTAKAQLDDKVTGFEVGADDYLTKPTHPTELIAHVKALLGRKGRAASATGASVTTGPRAMMIGVVTPHGGMGGTTVALNLASSLMLRTKAEVTVAEFSPGFGSLALDLDLDTKPFSNLLATAPSEITRHKVMESLTVHESGLRILPATYNSKDAELSHSASAQLEVVFSRLTGVGRYVVIDVGAGLAALNQKLLKMCTERIVVVEPIDSSIRHGRALIDDIVSLGIEPKTITVVSNNRVRTEFTIPWGNVQEQLGHAVTVNLTPAPELHHQATRINSSAVLAQPESLTAQQFAKLSEHITARQPKAV
ncbi:MAG: response regulator [Chloroflexota bacterium]